MTKKSLRIVPIVLMLPLMLALMAGGSTDKGLMVDFSRTVENPGEAKELVAGSLYYQAPQTMMLEVKQPVHQWLFFKRQQLDIYYPEEKRAFHIMSETNPLNLPFATAFVGNSRENFGFPEMGFTVSRTETKDDTLWTTWAAPKQVEKYIKNARTAELKGKLLLMESFTADGKLSTRAIFKSHAKYNAAYFPMEIYNGYQSAKGWVKESVVFSNARTLKTLPDTLLNFRIPPGTNTKEVKWQ